MNPTRRDALAAALAVAANSGGSYLQPACGEERKLTLATFETDVTIPLGHPCMGGGIAPAKEVLDPLLAHGFVLSGAGKPVVFVTLDWCEVRNGAYEMFREAIAKAVGTEPVRVMLCAVHQHDAPVADLEAQQLLERYKAKGAICDLAFLEKAVGRVAGAAKACLKEAKPVTHLGTGEAKVEKVASNRRYIDADGKVRYDRMSATRDPKIRDADEGTVDPLLKTISFWNGDTPLCALSAYATHPMSYYGRGGVTADFVGIARRKRQSETKGAFQMYASGCSGNVTAGKYNDGSTDNRGALAARIHAAMAAAWRATKKVPVKGANFRSVPLVLEPRSSEGFSEEALLKKLKDDTKPFGQCLAALGLSWNRRCDSGKPIDLPVLDFGGAAVTLLPAESYVEYQLAAQEARPNGFVLVAGYGECGPGYIPIERAWKENDGNLADWCWVNPGSEKRMREAISKALEL
ncbi:hypothetical protein GobsT_20290 [Gemmata obscuriglobus]|uniref:Neutral/alkaline non-lysosomal ceramidase N-terminal domain-containing protein n=1 Tax=Gemmata obscuriglobus TaxID=114 RepID=A0A2Z3H7S6_9BACT|nr:hypothetical protein [Gemmata obscuriglobus]AWM39626.1 hypothetical protein C1280_23250 [Gemmata obscuriglobus]QEG27275.1 hypothetical protein GobsT_20290 [Gemmata obscuriglobus]VTS04065.1 Uncharacterized protein OS=Chthoniobacter flavus Ellin428 GN=CfE428DRAFT_5616 PE=4 SV=1 [Gemmata obscuriglobus UQM 2246]